MTSASNTHDVVVHVNGKENEKSDGISNRAHYNEKRTEVTVMTEKQPTLGIFGLVSFYGCIKMITHI